MAAHIPHGGRAPSGCPSAQSRPAAPVAQMTHPCFQPLEGVGTWARGDGRGPGAEGLGGAHAKRPGQALLGRLSQALSVPTPCRATPAPSSLLDELITTEALCQPRCLTEQTLFKLQISPGRGSGSSLKTSPSRPGVCSLWWMQLTFGTLVRARIQSLIFPSSSLARAKILCSESRESNDSLATSY